MELYEIVPNPWFCAESENPHVNKDENLLKPCGKCEQTSGIYDGNPSKLGKGSPSTSLFNAISLAPARSDKKTPKQLVILWCWSPTLFVGIGLLHTQLRCRWYDWGFLPFLSPCFGGPGRALLKSLKMTFCPKNERWQSAKLTFLKSQTKTYTNIVGITIAVQKKKKHY